MQWPIPPFPTKAVVGTANSHSTSGTTHTKGSYTTVLTNGPAAASWLCFHLGTYATTGDRTVLADIAIGSSGNETVIVPNLLLGYQPPRPVLIPVHIPASATVRMRFQAGLTNLLPYRFTAYYGEPDAGLTVPGKIAAYGTNAATSGGTAIAPAGSSNNKGNWVQLTASTSAPIHALMVMVSSPNTTVVGQDWSIDIGVGGAGSETVIVPDIVVSGVSPYLFNRSPALIPLSMCLPAGVRLAARCSLPNSNTSQIQVAAYGITY